MSKIAPILNKKRYIIVMTLLYLIIQVIIKNTEISINIHKSLL